MNHSIQSSCHHPNFVQEFKVFLKANKLNHGKQLQNMIQRKGQTYNTHAITQAFMEKFGNSLNYTINSNLSPDYQKTLAIRFNLPSHFQALSNLVDISLTLQKKGIFFANKSSNSNYINDTIQTRFQLFEHYLEALYKEIVEKETPKELYLDNQFLFIENIFNIIMLSEKEQSKNLGFIKEPTKLKYLKQAFECLSKNSQSISRMTYTSYSEECQGTFINSLDLLFALLRTHGQKLSPDQATTAIEESIRFIEQALIVFRTNPPPNEILNKLELYAEVLSQQFNHTLPLDTSVLARRQNSSVNIANLICFIGNLFESIKMKTTQIQPVTQGVSERLEDFNAQLEKNPLPKLESLPVEEKEKRADKANEFFIQTFRERINQLLGHWKRSFGIEGNFNLIMLEIEKFESYIRFQFSQKFGDLKIELGGGGLIPGELRKMLHSIYRKVSALSNQLLIRRDFLAEVSRKLNHRLIGKEYNLKPHYLVRFQSQKLQPLQTPYKVKSLLQDGYTQQIGCIRETWNNYLQKIAEKLLPKTYPVKIADLSHPTETVTIETKEQLFRVATEYNNLIGDIVNISDYLTGLVNKIGHLLFSFETLFTKAGVPVHQLTETERLSKLSS